MVYSMFKWCFAPSCSTMNGVDETRKGKAMPFLFALLESQSILSRFNSKCSLSAGYHLLEPKTLFLLAAVITAALSNGRETVKWSATTEALARTSKVLTRPFPMKGKRKVRMFLMGLCQWGADLFILLVPPMVFCAMLIYCSASTITATESIFNQG